MALPHGRVTAIPGCAISGRTRADGDSDPRSGAAAQRLDIEAWPGALEPGEQAAKGRSEPPDRDLLRRLNQYADAGVRAFLAAYAQPDRAPTRAKPRVTPSSRPLLEWTISRTCSCAHCALDYDAVQFKRRSDMPKRPDVGVIAEQVIQRLKQIADQVTQNQRLADELGRLRDVVKDLERAIVSRVSGEQVPAAEPTERARRQTAAKRSRAATRPSAAKRATTPRGQNQAKILEALKGSEPMTASEIARLTGISAGTVSTTLTKMANTGELTKAERGYRLPG
jgi:CRP-like cAMP-binding protein